MLDVEAKQRVTHS